MEEKDIQRALQREYIPYYAMEEIKKRISDIEKDGYSYVDTTTENIVLRDYLVPNSLEPGYYTDKDFARLKDGEAIKVMKFSNGDKVRYCLVDEEDMVRHMPLSRLRARGDFLAEKDPDERRQHKNREELGAGAVEERAEGDFPALRRKIDLHRKRRCPGMACGNDLARAASAGSHAVRSEDRGHQSEQRNG